MRKNLSDGRMTASSTKIKIKWGYKMDKIITFINFLIIFGISLYFIAYTEISVILYFAIMFLSMIMLVFIEAIVVTIRRRKNENV